MSSKFKIIGAFVLILCVSALAFSAFSDETEGANANDLRDALDSYVKAGFGATNEFVEVTGNGNVVVTVDTSKISDDKTSLSLIQIDSINNYLAAKQIDKVQIVSINNAVHKWTSSYIVKNGEVQEETALHLVGEVVRQIENYTGTGTLTIYGTMSVDGGAVTTFQLNIVTDAEFRNSVADAMLLVDLNMKETTTIDFSMTEEVFNAIGKMKIDTLKTKSLGEIFGLLASDDVASKVPSYLDKVCKKVVAATDFNEFMASGNTNPVSIKIGSNTVTISSANDMSKYTSMTSGYKGLVSYFADNATCDAALSKNVSKLSYSNVKVDSRAFSLTIDSVSVDYGTQAITQDASVTHGTISASTQVCGDTLVINAHPDADYEVESLWYRIGDSAVKNPLTADSMVPFGGDPVYGGADFKYVEPPAPVDPQSVSLSSSTATVAEGEQTRIYATVTPSTATYTLVWSTEDSSIADVSNGIITGVKEGTTTVTVTVQGYQLTASCTVTVTPYTPPEPEPVVIVVEESETSDDGSVTESKTIEVINPDGSRTVDIEATTTNTDGSTVEATSNTKETTDNSGVVTSETESTETVKDSSGNVQSTTESSSTTIVNGKTTTTAEISTVKDASGQLISGTTVEKTVNENDDGSTTETSTTTVKAADGTTAVTTQQKTTEINDDGSISEVSTTTTSAAGVTVITDSATNTRIVDEQVVVSTASTVTSTDAEGKSTVTKVESEVATENIEGGTQQTTNMTTTVTLPTGEVTTTETESVVAKTTTDDATIVASLVTDTVKDGAGATQSVKVTDTLITITDEETVKETKTSVTDATGKETKVNQIEATTNGEKSVTTVATSDQSGAVQDNAVTTTLNYKAEEDVLDAEDVQIASDHGDKIAEQAQMTGDIAKTLNVNSGVDATTKGTNEAFQEMSSKNMALQVTSSSGTLNYDSDAVSNFSKQNEDITVTMKKDDQSALNDAQKEVIGDSTFVSVSAMAGSMYITDIGGTVTMTFAFQNTKGWANFAAYYVADDGSKELMDFVYDAVSGMMSVMSTHHSLYAVLEVEEPTPEPSGDNTLLYTGIIVALIVVVVVAYLYSRRN